MLSSETSPLPPKVLELIGTAFALGARNVPYWTEAEEALADRAAEPNPAHVEDVSAAIDAGHDPQGDVFCRAFTAQARRAKGATYTPPVIVEAMLDWAADRIVPARIVDPDAGSARFLAAAGRRFLDAELSRVVPDPWRRSWHLPPDRQIGRGSSWVTSAIPPSRPRPAQRSSSATCPRSAIT